MKTKVSKYVKIISVNLHILFSAKRMDTLKKIMEISIKREFLLMRAKKKLKNMKKMWIKIRNLIKSITKKSDDYDEKYIRIKFNSDDELILKNDRSF